MSYFTPDLTGTLETYRVDIDIFSLFEQGQKIVFPNGPIFLDTLTVTDVADSNVTLIDGTDWEAQAEDIDTTTISRMKAQDPTFNRVLISAITILKDLTAGAQKVTMSYQKLYPVTMKAAIGEGGGIDFTPELLADMMTRLGAIEASMGSPANMVVPSTISPKVLDFDQHGALAANLIEDEVHLVNTFEAFNLISPVQGAFFRDSVVVTKVDTSEVLVEGVDYLIKGFNAAHTKHTSNTSGVYTLIHILRELASEVSITYRAVGGEVTADAMKNVIEQTNGISEYLGTRAFLTPQSLTVTTPYQSIVNRMLTLEDQMRSLATIGSPTYGDTTNGTTVVKQLAAADTQQHWWNIATLYQVDGASDIFLSDRARFRLKLVGGKIMADLTIGVDLTLDRDNFTVVTDNFVGNLGYDLFGASDVTPPPIPQFRVIWNDAGGNPNSGIVLQMGTQLPGLTDTLVIEDYSGIESAWKVTPYVGSPESPSDDTITLPDGSSIWDSLSATSFDLVKTMPTVDKLYRAWEGSVALDTLDTDNAIAHLLPDYFRAEDAKMAQLVILDGDAGIPYLLDVPLTSNATDTAAGRAALTQAAGAPTDDLIVKLDTSGASPVLNIGPASASTWAAAFANHSVKYILLKV